MKTTKYLAVLVASALGAVAVVGCSSSSNCADGGVCSESGAGGLGGGGGSAAGGAGGGTTYFALTPGTYCFDILSTAPGTSDGCDLGVADLAGHTSLPVTYDMVAATIAVGTMSSLGIGHIGNNRATLARDNMPTDPNMTTCSWHQTDTTMLELIADNEFTISVTENESSFSSMCAAIPTNNMCTSTWTWTMKIDGALSPPGCM